MPEWDPEVEIGTAEARALIGSRFPELADAVIAVLDAGWDNTVFRVGGEWAFRFPRRQIAIPGVQREIDTLPRLAAHLPLPIPEPRWVGDPTETYPWPWFGARYLPGVELAQSGLADEYRVALGAQLGAFLRALHDPLLVERVGARLPVDPMGRADMNLRVPYTRRRLDQVAADGLWRPTEGVERLIRKATGLPRPTRIVVQHGDLHMRHVLVDARGRATGVIDWGDISVGDPSGDLSIAFGTLIGPARTAFFNAYGPIGPLTELRARVIATFLAAALLGYAAHEGMEALRREALRALERVTL